ncbi:hypothetical protein C4573_05655 [Candidatus Woesearchaeota archaeon]|nr:MAG: hypothetical protein C4573_05655 [Candidatus Woesearchaeota archaeon]
MSMHIAIAFTAIADTVKLQQDFFSKVYNKKVSASHCSGQHIAKAGIALKEYQEILAMIYESKLILKANLSEHAKQVMNQISKTSKVFIVGKNAQEAFFAKEFLRLQGIDFYLFVVESKEFMKKYDLDVFLTDELLEGEHIFILDRPYNKNYRKLNRVASFQDFFEKIKKLN